MAWLDWRLMLIVLALLPAVLGIVWLYQRLSAPAVTRARALRSDINGQMAESIGGMSVLQANNAQHRFGERFAATNEQHYTARVAELRANAFLLRPALDFLNVLLLAVVIFSFGQREHGRGRGGRAVRLHQLHRARGRAADPDHDAVQRPAAGGGGDRARGRPAGRSRRPEHAGAAQRHGRVASTRGCAGGAGARPDFAYPARPCCTTCRSRSRRAPSSASSATPAAASRPAVAAAALLPAPPGQHRDRRRAAGRHRQRRRFRNEVGLVPQDPFLLAASARENIDMGRGLTRRRSRRRRAPPTRTTSSPALEQGYDTPLGEGGSRLSSARSS
jgi:ATP-binding cassette subfamily B multidrug efflux pump